MKSSRGSRCGSSRSNLLLGFLPVMGFLYLASTNGRLLRAQERGWCSRGGCWRRLWPRRRPSTAPAPSAVIPSRDVGLEAARGGSSRRDARRLQPHCPRAGSRGGRGSGEPYAKSPPRVARDRLLYRVGAAFYRSTRASISRGASSESEEFYLRARRFEGPEIQPPWKGDTARRPGFAGGTRWSTLYSGVRSAAPGRSPGRFSSPSPRTESSRPLRRAPAYLQGLPPVGRGGGASERSRLDDDRGPPPPAETGSAIVDRRGRLKGASERRVRETRSVT